MGTTPNPVNSSLLLPPVQPVPFVLAPILFDASYPDGYGRPKQTGFPELPMPLFPRSIIRQGLRIIPEEYILVEKDEDLVLNNLGEGQTFILNITVTNALGKLKQPIIKIIKNRRCASPEDKHGRTLLLIQSDVSLDPLSLLPDNTALSLLSLLDKHEVGKIHPGQGDFTGKGHENAQGRGHENAQGRGHENAQGRGHTNCYGSGKSEVPVPDGSVQQSIDLDQIVTADRLPGSGKGTLVAVLDTGIIYTKDPPHQQDGNSCRTIHTHWNFVDHNADPLDNHLHRHGTRIATIVRRQSSDSQLVPVKVSNQDNVCTLYDVLCGLEYARVIGAKVINASWSFPASSKTPIPLLRAAIERFNGWVVCAAGNTSQYFPDPSSPGNPLPLGADDHYLFPACYSPTIDKVITVTTVVASALPDSRLFPIGGLINWKEFRQVTENRSDLFVDVGVVANAPLPGSSGNRGFLTPGFPPSDGSSFAAPCVTGAVATHLATHSSSIKKHNLLKLLVPATNTDARQLGDMIRDGRYYNVV